MSEDESDGEEGDEEMEEEEEEKGRKISAAAMAIAAGSFHEPSDVGGLGGIQIYPF